MLVIALTIGIVIDAFATAIAIAIAIDTMGGCNVRPGGPWGRLGTMCAMGAMTQNPEVARGGFDLRSGLP